MTDGSNVVTNLESSIYSTDVYEVSYKRKRITKNKNVTRRSPPNSTETEVGPHYVTCYFAEVDDLTKDKRTTVNGTVTIRKEHAVDIILRKTKFAVVHR